MTRRVAVISYAFRFPGTDKECFWKDLLDGRNLITEVQAERWAQESFLHPKKNHPGTSYTFAAGSIGDVSGFDAHFFGISPREATVMDPQQRLLLEMSWEALENGGICPSSLKGSKCGVFIGIASADYSYRLSDDLNSIDASVATGNTASIAANRLSYVFDLCGPSMAIDTACSSSLVAFHQACRSILSGESDQALTGGVSLHLHPYGFLTFSKASMLSPRGMCSVFDADADGYVRSEGGGIFFLKEYEQAKADGDPIVAVVGASAVNADGRKTGLTVPSPKRQAELLRFVYAQAAIEPEKLDYIEAHGTGTAVGDPVEVRAIGEALGACRSSGPLPIGSVKGNLGHLEAASGVAGLVKALHCLRHRSIPASVGMDTPNPNIDFAALNIDIVTKTRSLKAKGPLTVGINSFGFGGANAHVILQTPGEAEGCIAEESARIAPLILSARDKDALPAMAKAYGELVQLNTDSYPTIAYNASFRRDRLPHGLVCWPQNAAQAVAMLTQAAEEENTPGLFSATALDAPSGSALIYSGNGSQWAGMGQGLFVDPIFAETVAEIDTYFEPLAGFALGDVLAQASEEDRYQSTEIAQPALFAVQVGITRMLKHAGIVPVAVAGHSVGEVAAAWAAGILDLKSAVFVIYHRSRLQGTTKGQGQMTAVGMSGDETQELLTSLGLAQKLALAGSNSYRGATLAGDPDSLEIVEAELARRELFYRRLDLDYAFHSPVMDPTEAGVYEALADLRPQKGTLPMYSTVTGKCIEGTELGAEYWWWNIRQPVLFQRAVEAMQADGINIFMEIGPHPVLRSYLNDCIRASNAEGRVIPTLKREDDTPLRVIEACSQALLAGAPLDWSCYFSGPHPFMPLPNYPWMRERYWHSQTTEAYGTLDRHKLHPLLGYSLRQHRLTWENQLDTQLLPSLADHVVGDATVFPGTGYAELGLAAAFAWQGQELIEIEDLEIRSPLLLESERSQLIQVQIQEKDGSTIIQGRGLGGEEPWTVHGVCRILQEPGDLLLRVSAPTLPIRQPDFSGASHLGLTKVVGLDYGPAFQCIDHGWIIDHESVLAVLQLPEHLEQENQQMHLHPALLDCSFQLIIQLMRERVALNEGVTFIPVRMGRIAYRQDTDQAVLAQVRLRRWTEQSISADFTLFDGEGQVVAVIQEARFRRIRLRKGAADRLQLLKEEWEPMPLAGNIYESPLLSFKRIEGILSEVAARIGLSGSSRRFTQEVDPLLDVLCGAWIGEACGQLAGNDGLISQEKIGEWCATQPALTHYIKYILEQGLEDQGLIQTSDGYIVQREEEDAVAATDIWNSMVADYPDSFSLVHGVGQIGMHLAEIVEGRLLSGDIFPQRTSMAALICQVLGGEGKQRLGQALRQLVEHALRKLPQGARLGVVEIGREIPTHGADILAVMDPHCCDFSFIGTAPDFAAKTPLLEERYPHMRVIALEEEGELVTSLPQGSLVLVTLDFVTLAEATQVLTQARACLLPGGSLVVTGMHPARWIDFLYGGQPEHWQFFGSDSSGSRQNSAQFWMQQLQNQQLANLTQVNFSSDTLSGPYMLVGQATEGILPPLQSPVQAGPRSWIILADEQGISASLADKLATELQRKGDMVVVSQAAGVEALKGLLRETTRRYGELDGLLLLAGLSQESEQEAVVEVERQTRRCAMAAQILQACEQCSISTTCWLVSAGASVPGTQASNVQRLGYGDAPLWGFGRTLINEALDLRVHLLDLAQVETAASIAALVRELDCPDSEQEVCLTGEGARYVPRLQSAPRQVEPAMGDRDQQGIIRLGFSFAGKLGNLCWQEQPVVRLGEDEVEVEVHATGLNFRDLMFTLGLLSEEAIENGFAGPTLGLEFSGEVVRVGSSVNHCVPGDKVVGFGPSCFADRVITKATAITHLPQGISFEAAATIPCTFFTVYYALHYLAQLEPGERLLIHCAAGGVGIAAVQIAKWMGAEIYVTAGSREKRDFLRLLGVEHIFDSRSLAYADDIMEATGGQGVDVVLNSLAGEAVNRNFRLLKPFGRFLELGKRDFYENTKIGLRPFRNNISYFGIDTDQLMYARPELTRRLFAEVMDLFSNGILHPLPYKTFEAEEIVDAFRYMQQARHIGKIVVTYRNGIREVVQPVPAQQESLCFPEEASFLVTGGLGGFGLRTARWLVEKGARHLVLISRSGPVSDEAQVALEEFRQGKVEVLAQACDVTDRAGMKLLLEKIDATMPPLAGIVHAATVIDDGLIRTMDEAQIQKVMGPKVLGAYNLHQLTLEQALDFFILFSSATTLFGNPGQGNYVAANSALEALAHERREAGLAATCVRWGAIEDVGFLARNTEIRDALQGRMGGSTIESTAALEILENLLLTNRSGFGVMEIDWRALSRFLPSASSPKFMELARTSGKGDADDGDADALQRMLEELSEEELLQVCIDMLRSEVAEILRMAPDKLDPTRSMYDMGLDSLMGVELVGALESRFGIRLPVLILSQNPTITKLAEYIISQLRGTDGEDETGGEQESLAQQVQHLSDQHGTETNINVEELTKNLQDNGAGTTSRIIQSDVE
nr:type I polyketide synthase [uncultured Desulfobulbus sp.]